MDRSDIRALLSEQVEYYRAAADEYLDGAFDRPGIDELAAAIDAFAPRGDVLELACGPGTWTPQLLRHADTVTAVDASPEMHVLARRRVTDDLDRVRFVLADLFSWSPDRRYDVVFMGFWLSHVPWDHFTGFWQRVAGSLRPGGRVLFVDDDHRTDDELVHGAGSSTVRRHLRDGTSHRLVKVPHTPQGLEQALRTRGWDVAVHPAARPFYWGAGSRDAGTECAGNMIDDHG